MDNLFKQNQGILITGGSGFLGSHLIPQLQSSGKIVAVLGRTKLKGIPSFLWDIENQVIDQSAFTGIETIIHLAGAGITGSRWTKEYKKTIVDSRVKSADLLYESLKSHPNKVKNLISVSGIGYYGNTGDAWVNENTHSSNDFIGETCLKWEKAALQFEKLGIRVVILRVGLVLAKNGGVLPVIALPVKLFAGAPLGNGNQYMSWIHIEDLCHLFSFVIENENLRGIFNAVAPYPVTNKSFIKQIASVLHRPCWPVHVPAYILKLILGDKSSLVLTGQRVSSEKIREAGFNFLHTDLEKTFQQLLNEIKN